MKANMAPQPTFHPIYKKLFRNNVNKDVMNPMRRENQTIALKSVHGRNMSAFAITSSTSLFKNNLTHQNQTTTSSLKLPKQEFPTTYVFPSSLNIWLTHGL